MSTPDDASPAVGDASQQMFTRQATGLVRSVSPLTSLIINFTPGNPVQAIAAGLLFALSLFAGGNLFLAIVLILPMTLAFSYAYGLLTAAMPRTGGDYTLVSRILHPSLGVGVAFFQAVAQFLSVSFFAIAFVQIAIAPGLTAWGVIDGHQQLVDAGNTLATSQGWQLGLGVLMISLTALIMAGGWGWTSRVLFVLATMTIVGLVVTLIVALFTSHAAFIADFNEVVGASTGKATSYDDVLKTASDAGVILNPSFSFVKTIPLLAVMSTFAIYTYFSSYVGGELRSGGTIGTANRMALAGLLNLSIVFVSVIIFFHTFGQDFLTAAYGGGMPAEVPVPPYYFFLVGVVTHSGIVAMLLALSLAAFWPLIAFIAFLQPVRTSFAFAFDGILPKGVTKVSRTHSPYIAVLATAVICALTLVWAIYVADNFFTVLVYATIMGLVAMTTLGFAAMVFPWRRPEIYRASSTVRSALGIPLVSIAGGAAVASGLILLFLFFKYEALGIADTGPLFQWLGGTLIVAAVFYVAAIYYRRSQGVDVRRAYAEIPPE